MPNLKPKNKGTVKASALYMVIVIALLIAVMCGAVTLAGYYYRSAYQVNFRYGQLKNNLSSAITLLLNSDGSIADKKKQSLFGYDNDSVFLSKNTWGLFDVATASAFIQNDTLNAAFLIGRGLDSAKWATLYLIDEDRSVSVSGNTHIRGTAYLPKAGVREAYVNNQAYTGDKRLIIGTQKTSEKTLPILTEQRLVSLKKMVDLPYPSDSTLIKRDSLKTSFLKPTRAFNFRNKTAVIKDIFWQGNIVLYSDTTLTLDSTAKLDQVIIFAQSIIVKDGFKGSCQLFASDSIYVGKNCVFGYPSCLGVVNFNEANMLVKKLTIGDACDLEGITFIYDKYKNKIPPVLSLGKNTRVKGEVYVPGLINIKDKVAVYGSISANRFLYQTAYTRYENYMINLDLDQQGLSRYYLSSDLMPYTGKTKKILQWLK